MLTIWGLAKERYKISKDDGTSEGSFLFLAIDEAHNIISDDKEADTGLKKEIVKLLKTIAAEGRKFKIFLILISQRPEKINSNVISECDNFIVMKSTPPTIANLKDIIPIEEKEKSQLDEAFNFKKGEAIYCGKFTNYKPEKAEGDIKRTLK